MSKLKKVEEILSNPVFNKSEIAKGIQEDSGSFVSRSAMMNKLSSSNHPDKFSEDQLDFILNYFKKLGKQILDIVK